MLDGDDFRTPIGDINAVYTLTESLSAAFII